MAWQVIESEIEMKENKDLNVLVSINLGGKQPTQLLDRIFVNFPPIYLRCVTLAHILRAIT